MFSRKPCSSSITRIFNAAFYSNVTAKIGEKLKYKDHNYRFASYSFDNLQTIQMLFAINWDAQKESASLSKASTN